MRRKTEEDRRIVCVVLYGKWMDISLTVHDISELGDVPVELIYKHLRDYPEYYSIDTENGVRLAYTIFQNPEINAYRKRFKITPEYFVEVVGKLFLNINPVNAFFWLISSSTRRRQIISSKK